MVIAEEKTHHSTPVKPENVNPIENSAFREEMTQEECFHRRTSSVKGGEGPKRYGSPRESLVVTVTSEDGVDSSESSRRTSHVVVGWNESFSKFVPYEHRASE